MGSRGGTASALKAHHRSAGAPRPDSLVSPVRRPPSCTNSARKALHRFVYRLAHRRSSAFGCLVPGRVAGTPDNGKIHMPSISLLRSPVLVHREGGPAPAGRPSIAAVTASGDHRALFESLMIRRPVKKRSASRGSSMRHDVACRGSAMPSSLLVGDLPFLLKASGVDTSVRCGKPCHGMTLLLSDGVSAANLRWSDLELSGGVEAELPLGCLPPQCASSSLC